MVLLRLEQQALVGTCAPRKEEIVSTSVHLAGIIVAITVFAIPALGVRGKALGRAFHEARVAVDWPYMFDNLYGGTDSAYGPEF